MANENVGKMFIEANSKKEAIEKAKNNKYILFLNTIEKETNNLYSFKTNYEHNIKTNKKVTQRKNYKRGYQSIISPIYNKEFWYNYSPPTTAFINDKTLDEYIARHISNLIFERHKSVNLVVWNNIDFRR